MPEARNYETSGLPSPLKNNASTLSRDFPHPNAVPVVALSGNGNASLENVLAALENVAKKVLC